MHPIARTWIVKLAGGVRDAWLIFGVMLLVFLGAEVCYRTQGKIRQVIHARNAPSGTVHPYAALPWYHEFEADQHAASRLAWKPFVYFRRVPRRGPYVNIDSQRHRLTVQRPSAVPRPRRMFMFGGSTLFGAFQR